MLPSTACTMRPRIVIACSSTRFQSACAAQAPAAFGQREVDRTPAAFLAADVAATLKMATRWPCPASCAASSAPARPAPAMTIRGSFGSCVEAVASLPCRRSRTARGESQTRPAWRLYSAVGATGSRPARASRRRCRRSRGGRKRASGVPRALDPQRQLGAAALGFRRRQDFQLLRAFAFDQRRPASRSARLICGARRARPARSNDSSATRSGASARIGGLDSCQPSAPGVGRTPGPCGSASPHCAHQPANGVADSARAARGRARGDPARTVQILVGSPDREIGVAVVQVHRHVADRVRQVEADPAALPARQRRDRREVEELPGRYCTPGSSTSAMRGPSLGQHRADRVERERAAGHAPARRSRPAPDRGRARAAARRPRGDRRGRRASRSGSRRAFGVGR